LYSKLNWADTFLLQPIVKTIRQDARNGYRLTKE
jgi:hypothetical protein